MATIKQFQQLLWGKAKRLTLELFIGKGLIRRIENGGGSSIFMEKENIIRFDNVPEELKQELASKLGRMNNHVLAEL